MKLKPLAFFCKFTREIETIVVYVIDLFLYFTFLLKFPLFKRLKSRTNEGTCR